MNIHRPKAFKVALLSTGSFGHIMNSKGVLKVDSSKFVQWCKTIRNSNCSSYSNLFQWEKLGDESSNIYLTIQYICIFQHH